MACWVRSGWGEASNHKSTKQGGLCKEPPEDPGGASSAIRAGVLASGFL